MSTQIFRLRVGAWVCFCDNRSENVRKVKLSLCLSKHHAMQTYRGVERLFLDPCLRYCCAMFRPKDPNIQYTSRCAISMFWQICRYVLIVCRYAYRFLMAETSPGFTVLTLALVESQQSSSRPGRFFPWKEPLIFGVGDCVDLDTVEKRKSSILPRIESACNLDTLSAYTPSVLMK